MTHERNVVVNALVGAALGLVGGFALETASLIIRERMHTRAYRELQERSERLYQSPEVKEYLRIRREEDLNHAKNMCIGAGIGALAGLGVGLAGTRKYKTPP